MKTVLVFRASDIFMRDLVTDRLEKNGIITYGADASINVIYPNTPNLYLSGASAVIDGYRILVDEKDAEKASQLILELEQEVTLNSGGVDRLLGPRHPDDFNFAENDYVRKFYFSALFCLFLPFLPPLFAAYYLAKAMQNKRTFSIIKVSVSLVLILWNMMFSYVVVSGVYKMIISR